MVYKNLCKCKYVNIRINMPTSNEPIGFGITYRRQFFIRKWIGVVSLMFWNRTIEITKTDPLGM